MNKQLDLKQIHTKALLDILQGFREFYWEWRFEDEPEPPTVEEYYGCTEEDLRVELATREHIPNKKESKELRRQAAKKGKRNGKMFTKVPRGTRRT